MKLDEFVETKFWPYCEKLRRSTVVGYESAYRCHVKPRFGSEELEQITVEAIEVWLSSFEKTGAAKKAYAVLRCILRKAFKWQHCKFDPTVLDVDVPHRARYRPDVLNDKEILDLLSAFYGHELEPIVICSVTLGLRRCESCGLTWADIDLRSGAVSVNKGRHYVKGEVRIEPCKTDLSERVIYLPKFALTRLRELAKGHKKEDWLCSLSPDVVARRYKAFCRKEKLHYVPLKNLRHSYATSQLRSGVDTSVLSEMLGHYDVRTTERYYLVPDSKLYKAAQSHWESKLLKQSKIIEFAA